MARRQSSGPDLAILERRLDADLASTKGTMRIVVGVADAAEKKRAERYIAGKKNARLLSFETAAEAALRRGKP
jgi:hypothetical protein